MPLLQRLGRRVPTLLALALVSAGRLCAQVTETPQTIDPGKVLLRVDAISVGVNPDTSAPNQYNALGLAWALLSAGITQDIDLEVGTQFFVRDTYQLQGLNQTHSGIGQLSLRTKWTFWRDTTYEQSAAVIPYLNVPVNSSVTGNGMVEGGLIVPWALQVATGVKAGAMVEWDQLRNAANTRYDAHFSGSAVLQADVVGILGVYTEVTTGTSTAGSSASYETLNAGATLSVSKNFQWDFEVGRVFGPSATQWMETLRFRWKL